MHWPACWLVFMSWHGKFIYLLPLIHAESETLQAVCCYTILRFMQCKMLPFVFTFMRFNVQLTIYWCVTKIRRFCFMLLCWEPYILFKATFLLFLFRWWGKKNKAFWFGTLLKRCHAFVSFLQRLLCAGWPGTCAMTDIQYLNVFGLAGHTGFIELHTVWSLRGWTHVWEALWAWSMPHPTTGRTALWFSYSSVYIPISTLKTLQASPHSDWLLFSAIALLLWRSVY